jgi:hypothetical protein
MSRRFGVVVVFLVGAVMAGCEKSSDGDGIATVGGATPTATAARDFAAEQRRWAQCMREQGIDMPDPDPVQKKIIDFEWPEKGTAAADKYARAEQACVAYNTFNDAGGERKPWSTEAMAAWRAWAQCMRDNGVANQPDPGPFGFEPEDSGRDGDSGSAATENKAFETCVDTMVAARRAEAGQ